MQEKRYARLSDLRGIWWIETTACPPGSSASHLRAWPGRSGLAPVLHRQPQLKQLLSARSALPPADGVRNLHDYQWWRHGVPTDGEHPRSLNRWSDRVATRTRTAARDHAAHGTHLGAEPRHPHSVPAKPAVVGRPIWSTSVQRHPHIVVSVEGADCAVSYHSKRRTKIVTLKF